MLNGNYLYNPRVNPKAALDRRNLVLEPLWWKTIRWAPKKAAKLKLKHILLNYRKQDENAGLAPYFREELRA